MNKQIGDCYEIQDAALAQLKHNIKDMLREHNYDDYYLIRWLKAKNLDVKGAESLLRSNVEWRKKIGADTILKEYSVPEVVKRYYTGGLFGKDKAGYPLWFDPFGNLDMKGVLRSVKQSELIKSRVYLLEKIYKLFEEESKRRGKRIDQLVIILDLQNLGIKHVWKPGIDILIKMICLVKEHYPETLRRCFIINVPYLFPLTYNIVKPFLSEETKKKLHIVSGDFRSILLQYIDADQIPQYYGGACSISGDPKCSTKICYGGEVPKSYYETNSVEVTSGCYREAIINRGKVLQLKYAVKTDKTKISWHFTTENYDIGFAIFKLVTSSHKSGNTQVVLREQRVRSHQVPEEGQITCVPGTYVVQFDNRYSWTKSKRVVYLIQIVEPDAVEPDDSDVD